MGEAGENSGRSTGRVAGGDGSCACDCGEGLRQHQSKSGTGKTKGRQMGNRARQPCAVSPTHPPLFFPCLQGHTAQTVHIRTLYQCNSLLSRAFSTCSCPISPTPSSFTTALFFTCLARRAKSSVLDVSATHDTAGLMLAIITVRALPPSESCSRRVT